MNLFATKSKKKGFLLIATTSIATIMFACFLTSYKLIIHRGKVVKSFLNKENKNNKNNKCNDLKRFAYDELRRIDLAINRGEYKDGAEFVEKCEGEKIWLSKNKRKVSDNGYLISKMYYSGDSVEQSCFYNINKGSNDSFKELIMVELYRDSKSAQSIYVEFKKEYIVEGEDKKIVTKALIKLDYEVMERDPTKPQKEILKEFVVSLEDI